MTPDGQRSGLAALALPWLLALLFLWRPLLTGAILVPTSPRTWEPWSLAEGPPRDSNPLMGDSLILTVPWRLYNGESLRRGEIPFWNPWIFAGYPHLAALQSNALHPLVAPFDLWDPLRGLAWSMAIHLGLAGTFMFLYLRRLGLPVEAAALGAAAFEFNGFFLVRLSAPSYVFTGAWAPLVLLGLHEIALPQGRRRGVWMVALATAFAFLGGHPQILVLILGAGLTYAALGLPWEGRPVPELRGRAVAVARAGLATALGFGLAGFQLLPFLELLRESVRGGAPFAAHERLALPAVAAAQALIPDIFGHPVDGNYWFTDAARALARGADGPEIWTFNYSGENLYTGVAPLVLALFAIVRRRGRAVAFFAALSALALLVLFGTPLLRLVYEIVPTFRHSRADRIVFLHMLAVPALAGLGFADATGHGERCGRRRRLLVLALAALAALAVVWPLAAEPELRRGYAEFFQRAARVLPRQRADLLIQGGEAVIAGCAAVAAIALRRRGRGGRAALVLALLAILAPVFRFGWRFNPVQQQPLFRDNAAIERLGREAGGLARLARIDSPSALPPNLGQVFGLADVHGASAAALAGYARLVLAVDPEAIRKDKYFRTLHGEAPLRTGLLDLLGARLVLSGRELPLPEAAGFAAGPLRVYRNPAAMERFRLVSRVEPYETPKAGLERLLDPAFDRREAALVPLEAGVAWRSADGSGSATDRVEVRRYGAHAVDLTATAAGERLLVSSEVAYPGWEVAVDGRSEQTVLVNTAFRGVRVPAGTHQVRFRYRPRSFLAGLAVSALSAGLLVLVARRPVPEGGA